MKEIKAIIQPFMLDSVCAVLQNIEGLPGMTVSQVIGWGKSRAVNARGRQDLRLRRTGGCKDPHRRERKGGYDCRRWAALASLAVTLGGCATALPSPKPVLGRLAVASFVIEPTPLGDADASDREWFQELLAGHATATARRVSIEWELADRVEQSREPPRIHVLSGSVSVPIALPAAYLGSHATFQKGALAVARIELRDAQGALVDTQEVTVRWRDVRWLRGGPRIRRPRRPDAALIDAVELASERAVKRLAKANTHNVEKEWQDPST